MKPYFAYGSNLGASALRTRCPDARQTGVARIDGYHLGFTRRSSYQGGGVADLVPSPGSVVWGALFEIGEHGFDDLDEYEGVPTAYVRVERQVVRPDGGLVSAWVYVVASPGNEVLPSYGYWRIIVDGAKEAGLPAAYITQLEQLHHLAGGLG